jgi:hypothetical protein
MKNIYFICAILLTTSIVMIAQQEGDVIINEVGNGGTKKSMYTGGDYIELLVLKPEGVKLAGMCLTDLSSPSGTPKETEGAISFSTKEGSVFNQILPQGTFVLICLGTKDQSYGNSLINEDVSLTDGNNRIVVYANESPAHIDTLKGKISLTGKDNIALVSRWEKNAAVDIVRWEGASLWIGCDSTNLPLEYPENGKIVSFTPQAKNLSDFKNNSNTQLWFSSSAATDATPGSANPQTDYSVLKKND